MKYLVVLVFVMSSFTMSCETDFSAARNESSDIEITFSGTDFAKVKIFNSDSVLVYSDNYDAQYCANGLHVNLSYSDYTLIAECDYPIIKNKIVIIPFTHNGFNDIYVEFIRK